jgi:hypothetical protein
MKQYKHAKKMMRMMKGTEKGMEKMMKNMQSGQVKF